MGEIYPEDVEALVDVVERALYFEPERSCRPAAEVAADAIRKWFDHFALKSQHPRPKRP